VTFSTRTIKAEVHEKLYLEYLASTVFSPNAEFGEWHGTEPNLKIIGKPFSGRTELIHYCYKLPPYKTLAEFTGKELVSKASYLIPTKWSIRLLTI